MFTTNYIFIGSRIYCIYFPFFNSNAFTYPMWIGYSWPIISLKFEQQARATPQELIKKVAPYMLHRVSHFSINFFFLRPLHILCKMMKKWCGIFFRTKKWYLTTPAGEKVQKMPKNHVFLFVFKANFTNKNWTCSPHVGIFFFYKM